MQALENSSHPINGLVTVVVCMNVRNDGWGLCVDTQPAGCWSLVAALHAVQTTILARDKVQPRLQYDYTVLSCRADIKWFSSSSSSSSSLSVLRIHDNWRVARATLSYAQLCCIAVVTNTSPRIVINDDDLDGPIY